jgi:hypothetical protein
MVRSASRRDAANAGAASRKARRRLPDRPARCRQCQEARSRCERGKLPLTPTSCRTGLFKFAMLAYFGLYQTSRIPKRAFKEVTLQVKQSQFRHGKEEMVQSLFQSAPPHNGVPQRDDTPLCGDGSGDGDPPSPPLVTKDSVPHDQPHPFPVTTLHNSLWAKERPLPAPLLPRRPPSTHRQVIEPMPSGPAPLANCAEGAVTTSPG